MSDRAGSSRRLTSGSRRPGPRRASSGSRRRTSEERRLRAEVRTLGAVLGDTLRASEGEGLFALVERVRALSKDARRGDAERAAELRGLLRSLDVARGKPLCRAFAQFLALANVAEQGFRARVEGTHENVSPERVFSRILAQGVRRESLYEAVCTLRVELVLTAHPTQVTRSTLLKKYRRIAAALESGDGHPDDEAMAVIRAEIAAIWHTDELRRQRPSPLDEVRGGIALVEELLWDALPAAVRDLDHGLRAATGRALPLDAAPVRLGSWMGGDRDGNPSVTPGVTETACLLSRRAAAALYLREVEGLREELSVRPCGADLAKLVGGAAEPYRAWLAHVERRLSATVAWCEHGLSRLEESGDEDDDGEPYLDAAELWTDLRLCYDSLVASGLEVIAERRLLDVLRRVSAFGTTLFRLDVRQEASVHEAAVDALTQHLGLGRYVHWDEARRQDFLTGELASGRAAPLETLPEDAGLRDVMDTLAVCARQGPGSLGAYVVSMASRPSDVLAVMWLQQIAGLAVPMRVVPLFETLDALDGAPAVVERLLDLPEYRRAIDGELEVMVGYSDSAKDVGRLGAAWALYRMQESVAASCRDRGVELTLFHGRGGTIARGGGPIYLAILSQPPHSVNGRVRVTIQGETIDASFGVPRTAVHSICRYALAALETSLCPPASPEPEWRAAMDRLAEVGAAEYRRVVRETPAFVDYFQAVTPIGELGRLNIGSRPAHRRPDGGVESLRAIPWIFSWTQTRLLLPSWLGVGEALRQVSEEGRRRTLRAMVRRWPFFRSLVDLIEMVLAKADPDVAAAYEASLAAGAFGALGAELRQRCRETARRVVALKGQSELLEGDAFLRRSIALRNPYVDPLNLLQVELLRRIRLRDDPDVSDALLTTVKGIAAGMRNTG